MIGSTKLGPLEVTKFAVNEGLTTFIGRNERLHEFIAYAHRAGMADHPYQWRAIARDWDRIMRDDAEATPWAVG